MKADRGRGCGNGRDEKSSSGSESEVEVARRSVGLERAVMMLDVGGWKGGAVVRIRRVRVAFSNTKTTTSSCRSLLASDVDVFHMTSLF